MQKRGPGDFVQLATRIPKGLHRRVRLQAVEEGRPVMLLVAEAIVEHLARCRRVSVARPAPGIPREGA
jgi:hypothetical protein